ncbi:ECF transporter S component [Mesoplasma corruscae]|uniref:ECF transporter S component n=1 Tax=Mesoplasma corruscae TaxID=216874 RepID=A0A2S5RHK2_9MOLU|nr:ECF transporter S component [Mesoplasma corruscae]PPE06793.1 hypothetical protein MCORR_v1c04240 [Mesoplasma corruscae]
MTTKDKNKRLNKIEDISEEEVNKQIQPEKDQYVGDHHITKSGDHDHVNENEFKLHIEFRLSRSQLIFKIVLTGIFIALCFAVSAIDMALEAIRLPLDDQLWLTFKFLDIALITISIAMLGPIFASVISILAPWIHGIVHGFEHGVITPSVEMLSGILIVWLVWLVFYYFFKNSPIHQEQNKRKKYFKRFVPLPILITASTLITTALFVFALWVSPDHHHEHTHEHSAGEPEFDDINVKILFLVFCWNFLKYTLAFGVFSIIEWKMRPINHIYYKK